MLFSASALLVPCAILLARSATAADDVEPFIAKERPIALQGALNNIGPNGIKVAGASAGVVVASPSRDDPPYFYTWTRDSALVLKMIIDEFLFGNAALQVYIDDYVSAQAAVQTVTNPSGSLQPDGTGLGEPKFNVDTSRFNGAWGRPQRDGPALRAVALTQYANWLLGQGETDKVRDVIWPVIRNDLSYVGQYWNSTGFDLWEEVSGSSFFTTQNQYRSLVEGSSLARKLGLSCASCEQAPAVLCFLQTYWNGAYLTANVNANNGRKGVDANTVLGPISAFDVHAPCHSPTLQPCHSRSLANFKVFVDTFRDASLYPINAGVPASSGVAVGRYPEDSYYGGNPWYLIVQGAAEFLYDAAAQWEAQGSITIDSTSLPFFRGVYPAATAPATHLSSNKSSPFGIIVNATRAYGDSFVAVARNYTPTSGSLAEQFSRSVLAPGKPLSATDLTWSYSAFVTMAQRRAGQFPPSWVPTSPAPQVPTACVASSTKGTYAPATGGGGGGNGCTADVLFVVNATTYFGENVYVAGDAAELGAWDLAAAQPLSATNYTAQRPEWFAHVALAGGTGGAARVVKYAYARQENCGQPWIWETTNRTVTVPACPDGGDSPAGVSTNDAWVGPVGSGGNC